MTAEQLAQLREVAERAASDDWGYDRDEFYDVLTPEMTLALLDELERKDKRIAELEAISSAAEKLVRCKGRYHSEQNYRALAALFGVTTPDLPPLESEARTVTVKLPQPIRATALGRDFSALQYSETVKLLLAAGINLTVEG